MREAAFVKQNLNRWKSFEALLAEERELSPDKKSELFVQLTDDLSFSRTQYPDSETTRYLNHLSSKIHQQIYKNKREDRKRFVTFWVYEVPRLMNIMRKPVLYSFMVTLIGLAIGVISTLGDKTFVRLILGDAYVNMTLENIHNGNPLGVYGSGDQLTMFLLITFNNIKVSFMAFAYGLVFSVGTAFILLENGIMLGAFLTMFYQKHLLLDSILGVMLHGTLEISAIIIAGGAGFRMGNSFLFPGTYSRMESLKRGARDGIKIIMALIPIFMVAGFIESFITRYTQMPVLIKVVIILISLCFLFFYFFVYPLRLQRHDSKN
jgi:uncharacterized membrane protein SpoIIM required for sporulation